MDLFGEGFELVPEFRCVLEAFLLDGVIESRFEVLPAQAPHGMGNLAGMGVSFLAVAEHIFEHSAEGVVTFRATETPGFPQMLGGETARGTRTFPTGILNQERFSGQLLKWFRFDALPGVGDSEGFSQLGDRIPDIEIDQVIFVNLRNTIRADMNFDGLAVDNFGQVAGRIVFLAEGTLHHRNLIGIPVPANPQNKSGRRFFTLTWRAGFGTFFGHYERSSHFGMHRSEEGRETAFTLHYNPE